MVTILDAMRDPALFGRWFDSPTWDGWRVFLAALHGLPLPDGGLEVFRRCTGRTDPPTRPCREGWAIAGRRGGKSRIAGLNGIYLAAFKDYRDVLAPGEVGTLPIIAADRRQARTIMRYINGFLDSVPMLSRLVESRTAESVTLSTRVVIEVHTASFRAIRGYTLVGAILDELAYFRTDDSASPDHEILAGIRPGMATVPGSLLLCISSPYARRGALYDTHKRYFGKDGDVLVWQADSRTMNPTIPERVVADAYAADPAIAASEYGAQFRSDLEQLFTVDALTTCIEPGVTRRPPIDGVRYVGFCDPSGGGADSFAAAVAHFDRDRGRAVLDHVEEWRGSPAVSVRRCAELLKVYGLSRVTGDAYTAGFVVDAFREHGIEYQRSTRNRSEIYLEALPLVNAGKVELLDDDKLLTQLQFLERRTGRSGRDTVDHPRGAHDDRANAAAGALVPTGQDAYTIVAPVAVGIRPSPWRQ